MPKSGLISSKNLNNPGLLSIITEQEFEESRPSESSEEPAEPATHVPITMENAFRLGHVNDLENLPFRKNHTEMSFLKKKTSRPIKTQVTKVKSQDIGS
jgi:hypothetical protein